MPKMYLSLLVSLCGLAATAQAAVVTSTGSGTAVPTVSREATFDNLANNTPLVGYTESGVVASTPDYQCGAAFFPGTLYPCSVTPFGVLGGNYSYVTISTPELLPLTGVEADLFSGYSSSLGLGPSNVVWETLRGNVVTGSGVITDLSIFWESGVVVGWSDVDTFDTLRFGVGVADYGYTAFGGYNVAVVDGVRVGIASVPEPSTLVLLALGLAACFVLRPARMR